jgi:hypothetical protein
MNFDLHTPCKDCPFRAVGAIQLSRGRVSGIIEDLKSDFSTFQCHKSVHSKAGGEWDDETGDYIPSGNEQACPGSLAYMLKNHRQVSILTRFALRDGSITKEQIEAVYPLLKDPKDVV